MSNKDWFSPDDLGDFVQGIIDSKDFSKLNDSISRSVNDVFDSLDQALNGSYTSAGSSYRRRNQNYTRRSSYGTRTYNNRSYSGSYNTADSKRASDRVRSGIRAFVPWREFPERYLEPSAFQLKGAIQAGLGAFVGLTGLGSFLQGLSIGAIWGSYAIGSLAATALVGVLGAVVFRKGLRKIKLSKKYRQYSKALKDREYCRVEDLAVVTNDTADNVRKNVKGIIKSGLFRQGHLDQNESNLMVTDAAYEQYQQAYMEYGKRKAEEEAARKVEEAEQYRKQQEEEKRKEKLKLDQEAQRVVDEGRAYVEEIKRCNRNIPGVQISEKISRLEYVCDRIFNRVEEHPELIEELRKFMKYYLPTTVKLLQAYEGLDKETVQGENIMKSKQEIEATLDTINTAFTNLLDGFFQNDAMDIKSDISVMQTMFAQEGLLNNEMGKAKAGASSTVDLGGAQALRKPEEE